MMNLKTAALIGMIFLFTTGPGIAADPPPDELLLNTIQQFLSTEAASGADFIGMQFYGWMTNMRNVRFSDREIVKIGKMQDRNGVEYWPVRARFTGTFQGLPPLGSPQNKRFDTTANFMVYANDFGEWKAEFLGDEPIVSKGKPGAGPPRKNRRASTPKDTAPRRSDAERAEHLKKIFAALPTLSGEARTQSQVDPFKLTIKSYDSNSGKWTGEMEWPTMDSLHRVEGKINGANVSFTETERIRKGKAMINVKYQMQLDNAEKKINGTWRTKIVLTGDATIHLD